MLSAQSVCDLFEEGILQAEEQAWPFISDSVGQQVFAHLFEREFFQPGALGDATESRVDVCDQKAAVEVFNVFMPNQPVGAVRLSEEGVV